MGWPAQSVLSLVLQAHSIPRGTAYNMIQDQECKANGDLGSWDGYVRGKWYLARVPEGEAGWMEKIVRAAKNLQVLCGCLGSER